MATQVLCRGRQLVALFINLKTPSVRDVNSRQCNKSRVGIPKARIRLEQPEALDWRQDRFFGGFYRLTLARKKPHAASTYAPTLGRSKYLASAQPRN
jgi:hypothetical protein